MITAQKVKELRDRTGVGMAKCKKALEEVGGDIEAAIDNLRKSGMASAVKKEGRDANEGLIAHAENSDFIALVEVNSETDFVAKNEKFKEFIKVIADEVLNTKPASVESFLAQKFSKDQEISIDQYRASTIQLLGENIVIKRLELIEKKSDHSYGYYAHMQGKIVSVAEVTKPGNEAIARDVSMHVAAEAPDYLNPESVPQDVLEHEKEIASEQIKGKPENIIEKILAGKLNTFYEQVCLTRQRFIKENKQTVEQFLKDQGEGSKVTRFVRWQVGN